VELDAVAVRVLGQAAGAVVPFSGPAVEALLSDVLVVQDEQVARLRKLEEAAKRLAEGKWKAGRLRLQEASLPRRTVDQRQRLVTGAADNFRDAIELQPEPSFARAQVCLDLAMTLGLLGDVEAMRHYAQLGYVAARRMMWMETETQTQKNRGESVSRSNRDALVGPSAWFEDFEYAAVDCSPAALTGQAAFLCSASPASSQVLRTSAGVR